MVKGIFRVLSANIVAVVVGFVTSLLFPKVLTVEDYALYQTFILYSSYLGLLSLGFPSGLFIKYGGVRYSQVARGSLKSEIHIVLLCGAAAAVGLLALFGMLRSPVLLYCGVIVLPLSVITVYKTLYQAWDEFAKYSVVTALGTVLPLLITGAALVAIRVASVRLVIVPMIVVDVAFAVWMMAGFVRDTRGVRRAPYFSPENGATLKVGFVLTLANAANLLFTTLGRFFALYLFPTGQFAVYAFAMSLQSLLNVAVSAVALPVYPRVASGAMTNQNLGALMRLLLGIGSLSGTAYFACSIVVRWFLPAYVDSLGVIRLFFVVFPVIAVINGVHVNLYKARNRTSVYLVSLVGVILATTMLSGVGVLVWRDVRILAVANSLGYVVWLILASRTFREVRYSARDAVYSVGYVALYFLTTDLETDVVGLVTYTAVIAGWFLAVYRREMPEFRALLRT